MLSLWPVLLLAFTNTCVVGKAIIPSSSSNNTETRSPNSTTIVGSSSSSTDQTQSLSIVTTSKSALPKSRTSSTGVGDYVAHGLGMDDASSALDNGTQSVLHRTSPPTSSDSSTTTSTIFVTISTSIAASGRSTRADTSSATVSNNSAPVNSTHLHNLTYTGACWDQWTDYWSYSAANVGDFMAEIVATETTLYPELETTLEFGTYTLTDTWTYYSTALEGAFPTSMFASTGTETDTLTWRSGVTFTITNTVGSASGETVVTTTGFAKKGPITTPSCVLPSIVPQCQSMWSAWVNDSFPGVLPFTCSNTQSGPCSSEKSSFTAQFSSYVAAAPVLSYAELLGPTPLCSQASVPADGCSSLVKYLLTNSDSGARQTFDAFPSDSVLAPGCTVGCQTCAITGNSVQLYYWPPATATTANQSNSGQPTITPAPRPATQVSMHDGTYFTFTSPTIYVSYEMLYASDSCSGIGPTFRNTIIPLTGENQLSSLMVFLGDADYPDTYYKTVPFNLTDLAQTPVPASIYNKDPKCASSSDYTMYWDHVFSPDWATDRVSFSCRQTAPYAPIIAVPEQVSNLDPAWKHCTAWYGGLYDPPQALTAATAEVVPTLPSAAPSHTPAPSNSPIQSPAKVTANSEQPIPSQNAQPETMASSNSRPNTDAPKTEAAPSAVEQTSPDQNQEAPHSTAEVTADPGGIIASVVGDDSTAVASTTGDPRPAAELPPKSNQAAPTSEDIAASPIPEQEKTQVVTAGGSIISIVQSQGPSGSPLAIINGQTVAHGQVTTINGATMSIGTAGIIVDADGSQTTMAPPPQSPDSSTAAAQIITAGDATLSVIQDPSATIVNGQTLSRGQAATIAGQSQSLSLNSEGVIVGGSDGPVTVAPAPSPGVPDPPDSVVAVGSASYTVIRSASQVLVAQSGSTATLRIGSGTLFNGQMIRAGSKGGVVIGSMTVTPIDPPTPGTTPFEVTVTGSDGHLLTFNQQGSSYVIAAGSSTHTLAEGAKTVINGETISLPNSGEAFVVDGSAIPMPTGAAPEQVMTFDGHTLSAIAVAGQPGVKVVDGVTLTSGGGAKTVDGVKISIGEYGLVIYADGSATTMSLSSGTASHPAPRTSSVNSAATTNPSKPSAVQSAASTSAASASSSGASIKSAGVMALILPLVIAACAVR